MHISRVQIKNLLSISSVDLKPGKITQIVGGNNAGKTTILRAIQFALQGTTDRTVVKTGENQAEIVLEFNDETVVRRRIKADGTQNVSVKNKDGFSANKPQELLDGLINQNAFNPLDLLDPKKRTEALLKSIEIKLTEKDLQESLKDCPVPMPPLDYSQHGLKVVDSLHKYFYARRAEANKVAKDKKQRYEVNAGEIEEQSSEELPTKESMEKKIKASESVLLEERSKYSLHRDRRDQVEDLKLDKSSLLDKKVSIENQIKIYTDQLETVKVSLEENSVKLKAAQEKLEEVKPDMERVEKTQQIIKECQQTLTKIAQAEGRQEKVKHLQTVKKEADEAQAFADKLDFVVQFLSHKFKSDLMAKANLPVKGLSYEDGQFFLDGSSIDNLSTSKAIKLSIAIAKKLAGKTKIICLDGAEALDSDAYDTLRKEIEGDEFSYFISKVGDAFHNAKDTVVTMDNGAAV